MALCRLLLSPCLTTFFIGNRVETGQGDTPKLSLGTQDQCELDNELRELCQGCLPTTAGADVVYRVDILSL